MVIYENSLTCILCGRNSTVALKDLVNHEGWITGRMPDLSLAECHHCKIAFLVPASSLIEQWRWYPTSYSDRSRNSRLQQFFMELAQKNSSKKIRSEFGTQIKILDFGGGDGSWCKIAIQQGLDAKNYDPFFNELKNPGELEKNDTKSTKLFDVVRLEHVLEHALDPVSLLTQCKDLLRIDGVIVGNTPNVDSISFKIFKKNWGFLHAPHHPVLFSKDSLELLASTVGLKVRVSPTRISSCWGHSIENVISRTLRLNRLGHLKIYPFLLLIGQLIEFVTTSRRRYGSELHFVFKKEKILE